MVRTALSSYQSVLPEEWRFEAGHNGKPELVGNHRLVFNISHCEGIIACAVARTGDLGVDVEPTRRRAEALAIAEHYFSAKERSSLLAIDEPARRVEHFFELWTLKESFIKACGLGLSAPLDEFAFLLDNKAPRPVIETPDLLLFSGLDVRELAWKSWLCTLSNQHKLSITIGREAKQDYRLRFFQSVPLVSHREIQLPLQHLSAEGLAPMSGRALPGRG